MSGDKSSPDEGRSSSAKGPLRTYSRHGRAMKRSFTSLSRHLTRSDDVAKGDFKGVRERTSEPQLHEHRKRTRASNASGQRPTDVFWEHLSASAPAFIRPQETDHFEKTASPKAEQTDHDIGATALDEEPQNMLAEREVDDKHGQQGVHTQWSSMAPSEGAASASMDQDEGGYMAEESKEDPLQPDMFDDTASTHFRKFKVKRGSLLSSSCLPDTRKAKKTRRYHDIDESLSDVKSSLAGVWSPLVPRDDEGAASETNKFKGLQIPRHAKVKHSIDSFDSPAGPWSIPIPTSRRKYADFKGFKEVKVAQDTKPKRSSDGFERDEARSGLPGKKRKIESSELNIGPLELTQKGVATQKMEGPTWLRGQKKPRVSTAASLWSKRQHFGTSEFQIESEDSFEAADKTQTSAGQATHVSSKRRINRIMSDGADVPPELPVDPGERDGRSDSAYDDLEVVRSSQTEHGNPISSNCDADEPVDLLVFPFDEEDEAGFTIPRTDTPEPNADTEGELVAQLPPKRWMLDRLDDGQDTLALRPNSNAWKREVSSIPETSDL